MIDFVLKMIKKHKSFIAYGVFGVLTTVVNIVAYIFDSFGTEQFVDGVYPGFSFEINDKLDKNNEMIWMHQYWGHLKLHNIQAEEEL